MYIVRVYASEGRKEIMARTWINFFYTTRPRRILVDIRKNTVIVFIKL